MRIILASKSPRRQELLKNLGFSDFEIIPAVGEEIICTGVSPAEEVMAIAAGKANEIAGKNPDALIIAADTLVFLDGKALGKPKDEAEAFDMLHSLSGRAHTVITGVCVVYNGKTITESEETKVFFRELSDDEIWGYIRSGEPMDKAGAYGIQALGSVFIPRIEGDYFNVMGLPVCRLYSILEKMGIFEIMRGERT